MTVMRALRCFEFPVSHTMNRRGKPEQLAVAIEFLLSEDAGLSLPPKNESLAERVNSRKEKKR